jgi:hypothetical protein
MTSMRAEYFFEKYKTVLSKEQYNRLENFNLGITKSLVFPDEEMEELDRKFEERKKYDEALYKTAQRNTLGIQLEKQQKIEEAIKVYEENIVDKFLAMHSYDRLMILYRKQKRYSDELRVIEIAIDVFSKKENYSEYIDKLAHRKNKTEKYLQKR